MMTTIILNTVLALIVIIPMLYFMFGNSQNRNKTAIFRQKANLLQINPDKVGLWQSGAIGLDKNQKKLCYTSELQDDQVHEIDLNSIISCDVKKIYDTENIHQQDISILKKVSLQFITNKKSEISIPVYDANLHTQPGNDLLEAIEWSKIISKFIKEY